MIDISAYFAIALVGLLGGVHCFAMCGGIVGALTLGLPREISGRFSRLWPYLLAYNGGRIVSYTIIGMLAGALGGAASLLADQHSLMVLRTLAATVMITLGLYMTGLWSGITVLERGGAVLWRQIAPLARKLMPVSSPGQAFAAGLVWGWLPCGLIYSATTWALVSGSWLQGGLLMLSFGLGTLPTLLAIGIGGASLAVWLKKPRLRVLAGIVLLLFGVWTLFAALTHRSDLFCRI